MPNYLNMNSAVMLEYTCFFPVKKGLPTTEPDSNMTPVCRAQYSNNCTTGSYTNAWEHYIWSEDLHCPYTLIITNSLHPTSWPGVALHGLLRPP